MADVVALCRRLDGLPLARRARRRAGAGCSRRGHSSDHLDEALGLPLPGHPERQQTMMATVDWSYRMVDEAEQRAFRALAAFGAAGGSFEARSRGARIVDRRCRSCRACSTPPSFASTTIPVGHASGCCSPCARSRSTSPLARASSTTCGVGTRSYYLALAERAGDRMKSPDAMAARAVIELEMDNLRAALDWSLGEAATVTGRTTTGERPASGCAPRWAGSGTEPATTPRAAGGSNVRAEQQPRSRGRSWRSCCTRSRSCCCSRATSSTPATCWRSRCCCGGGRVTAPARPGR